MYQTILESLLHSRRGFRAAVLLDADGETVVAAGRDGDPDEHRVLGAYQGIYLRDLARALSHCGLGAIEQFSLRLSESRVFTESLMDGYYLVLLASPEVPSGVARQGLSAAAGRLRNLL